MANDTKFTHISVTVDDDDDFVIEAGAPAAAPVEPEPAESAGVAAASAASAAEPAAPVAVAAVSAVEPAIAPAAPVVASAAPAAAQKPASQGYRETTLDDLEGEKMSGMQKGVIAAAFVAIIVFNVYLVL